MKTTKKRLKTIISAFGRKKVLVVGDLILDRYVFGSVDRISPEAPVPVVWANKETFLCGGAANVGLNLVALDAGVSLCGVLGSDSHGKTLKSLIGRRGIDTKLIVSDKVRPTTLKTRVIANHQQVVRVDWESVNFLSKATNEKILNKVKRNINEFDAVIIEDYGKGVVNPKLVKALVDLCKDNKRVVTVDPKEEHFQYYKDVTALTPNLKEAQTAAGIKIRGEKELPLLGKMIINNLRPKFLLLTLGEGGMMLFDKNKSYHIPTDTREVFDVTGAGDTVISIFTLALCAKATPYEAALIANCAAGIVVGKSGAATTNKKELFKRIDELKI